MLFQDVSRNSDWSWTICAYHSLLVYHGLRWMTPVVATRELFSPLPSNLQGWKDKNENDGVGVCRRKETEAQEQWRKVTLTSQIFVVALFNKLQLVQDFVTRNSVLFGLEILQVHLFIDRATYARGGMERSYASKAFPHSLA